MFVIVDPKSTFLARLESLGPPFSGLFAEAFELQLICPFQKCRWNLENGSKKETVIVVKNDFWSLLQFWPTRLWSMHQIDQYWSGLGLPPYRVGVGIYFSLQRVMSHGDVQFVPKRKAMPHECRGKCLLPKVVMRIEQFLSPFAPVWTARGLVGHTFAHARQEPRSYFQRSFAGCSQFLGYQGQVIPGQTRRGWDSCCRKHWREMMWTYYWNLTWMGIVGNDLFNLCVCCWSQA